jgi:hypothetical protein
MAKKQSRRSVSLNRDTYERLRAYCETHELPMSQFVEERLGEVLGRSAGRSPGPEKAPKDEKTARKAADRIFTF